MTFFFRNFIFFYFIAFFLALFVLPSILVWRKTGANPLVLPRDDSAYGLIGWYFKILMLLTGAFAVSNFFVPENYHYFMPVNWFNDIYLRDEGSVLMIFSFVLIFVAQRQMQDSWRIGIDEKNKTALVNKGLFRYSRNPIFLGMIFALLGLFLAAPCAFTLMIFILGFVLIQIQVRLEEEFLTRVHGQDYLDYRKKVKRWFTIF